VHERQTVAGYDAFQIRDRLREMDSAATSELVRGVPSYVEGDLALDSFQVRNPAVYRSHSMSTCTITLRT